jgi:cell division protein FtsB
MTFSEFWTLIRVRKWGKYVITVLLFLAVFLFIGDQSLLRFIDRGREIRQLEEQRDQYRSAAEEAQREIQTLHNTDSLERFAREQYFMHNANEDIYLVNETE